MLKLNLNYERNKWLVTFRLYRKFRFIRVVPVIAFCFAVPAGYSKLKQSLGSSTSDLIRTHN
jgi:hypothetical protein